MRRLLLALVAGSVMVLAYAPFGLWWLAFPSLALLFWLWSDATPGRCFWLGFCWGFGIFMAGISWVFISLQVYGQMPVPLAVVAVIGFVAYLSLFPGMAGAIQAWFGGKISRSMRLLIIMPASWVLIEWVRGWALTGFPWLNAGYTQVGQPLAGFAPVGGIYLVSFAVAVLASGLVLVVISPRRRLAGIAAMLVVLVSGWGLSAVSWVEDDGPAIRVAVVQGNISLDTKWQQSSRTSAIEKYLSLSPTGDVDLVVWPETAVSYYVHEIPGALWSELERRNGDYVFGTIEAMTSGNDVSLYNSVVVMCNGERQLYRKRHLVPFGEYMPLTPIFGWILEYLHIPMSDFSSWQEPQSGLCAGGTSVSVSVCYEDAFANEMRSSVGDSSLLLNVSEDAWFGDSLAPHQRLQMARMRVREVGRPMVRASNTGPSVILDHRGQILASTGQFEAGSATALLQPTTGTTPYTRFGDFPVILILGVVLLAARFFPVGIRQ